MKAIYTSPTRPTIEILFDVPYWVSGDRAIFVDREDNVAILAIESPNELERDSCTAVLRAMCSIASRYHDLRMRYCSYLKGEAPISFIGDSKQ